MAITYVSIATVTLTSTASSISFTSIPGTYTDLVLQGVIRSARINTAVDSVYLTLNGDTTNSNYSMTYAWGNTEGGAVTGAYLKSRTEEVAFVAANDSLANNFGPVKFFLGDYSGSDQKGYQAQGGSINTSNTTARWGFGSAGWASADAITSISIASSNGANLATGCSVTLYGIKKA